MRDAEKNSKARESDSARGPWLILAMGVVLALLFYTVAGFVVVPRVLEAQLPKLVQDSLSRELSIGSVRFDPFRLILDIDGLRLADLDSRTLFAASEIEANFSAKSVVTLAVHLDELRVTTPEALIHLLADGELSIADLLEASGSETAPELNEDAEPLDFAIAALRIEAGTLRYLDEARAEVYESAIAPLTIELENLSSDSESQSPYSLDAKWGDAEIHWKGSLALGPLRSRGSLALGGLEIPEVIGLAGLELPIEIRSGFLALGADYELDASVNPLRMRTEAAHLAVSKLQAELGVANGPGERGANEALRIDALRVEGIALDTETRRSAIGSITVEGGRLQVQKNAGGEIDWMQLASPENPAAGPSASEGAGSPWIIDIADAALSAFTFGFGDASVTPPAEFTLTETSIKASQLRPLDPAAPIPFSFKTTLGEGQIAAEGLIRPKPEDVELDWEVRDFDLSTLQPYLATVIDGKLKSGKLSSEGLLRYDRASSLPDLRAKAGIRMTGLTLVDHSDGDILSLKGLEVDELDYVAEASELRIARINLSEPEIRYALAEDGRSNLSRLQVSTHSKESTENEATTTTPFGVYIGEVALEGGSISFQDRSQRPAFSASLAQVGGHVRGLSSEQLARAEVDLKGSVDGYAPVQISGQINPLSDEVFTDLTARVSGVELPNFSTYSGRYISREISRGKLSLDLHYRISKQILRGENQVFIDQLTLGEEVDSPDATTLPVPLAIALLKNQRDEIDIDLPVRGNLANPEFSYGGMILQAVTQLITTVATSPFAALSAIVPGEQGSLDSIVFAPGTAKLAVDELEKVAGLASALTGRPGLRLDILPSASRVADHRALASTAVAREFEVSAEEFAALLENGDEKAVKQLAKAVAKTPDEAWLRELGRERGLAVIAAFQAKGVASERLFVNGAVVDDGDGESIPVRFALRPN